MKKCALLLSILMLISSFSFPGIVFAEEEMEFMTNIGFADTATYDKPKGVTVSGKQYVAKVISGGIDKALYMKNAASKLTVVAPVIAGSGMYYLQTRVKLDDINSSKDIKLQIGSTKIDAISFSPNLHIYVTGEKYTSFRLGKWVDIAFMIDAVSGKGDIYIDGRLIDTRLDYGKGAVSALSFESAASEIDTAWSIDYVRSYESDKVLAYNAYKYEVNSEKLEDSSLELPAPVKVQSQRLVGFDFEDTAVGSVPDGFWTKNSPYIDERKDGEGKAFKVARTDVTVAGENYIDLLTNSSLESAVIEADIYNPDNGNSCRLFTLRDKPGNFATLLNMSSDGTIRTPGGEVVAKGVNKNWTNIAVALDFSMRTYSVYANRELVIEEVPIPNDAVADYIQLVRFEMQAGAAKGEVWYDNMFVYTGNELQPFSEDMKKLREEEKRKEEEDALINGPKGEPLAPIADPTYFTLVTEQPSASPAMGGYSAAKSTFKDAFCIVGNVANVMIGGEKYSSATPTLYEGGVILAPVRMLGAAYGMKVGYDDATGMVTLGDIKLKDGDTSFTYKDKVIDLSMPVTIQNGTTYLELRPFAEKVANCYMHQDDYGIAVISAEKIGYGSAHEAVRYLAFDRPNADTLYSTLVERYPDNAHPRAYFTKDEFDKALELSNTDPNVKKWSESAIKSADSMIKAPLPVMAYDSAGLRLQNLPSIDGILTLYWAYIKTGDEKYADYAIKQGIAACENYTTWGHNTHYLEVGQTTGAMGLLFDLFYDKLTQAQKDQFAGKIVEYGLEPSVERYHGENKYNGLHWPTNVNNWNVVVNKGLLLGAVAIADEYETNLCADIMEKSIRSLEYMMPTFAPEGAWGEGPSYWDYTVSNTVIAIKTMYTAFGDDYGISDSPAFLKTGYYPFNLSGNSGLFAYHDSPRVYKLNGASSVFYLAELAGDKALAGLQLYTMNKNNAPGGASSIMYYNPDMIAEPAGLEKDVLYTSSQVALTRSDWGTNAVWAAVHAGANDFAHGHVDIGTFEYEADGVRFANEVGKDDYNLPGYWDTSVRNLYIGRAEGHNVYVINPDMGAGQEVRGKSELKEVAVKDQGTIYTIDMFPAYITQVDKALRGFKLSDNRRVFTVQDEITPKGDDEYYWFWHTVADIEISEDGKSVVLTNNKRKVTVYFDSDLDFTIEKGYSLPLPTSPVVDGQLGGLKNYINKITVRFKSKAGEPFTFRATAVPSGCKLMPEADITPISEWTIPDGPINVTYPEPTAILMDGVAIEGFDAGVTEYAVPVYKVPDEMPVISLQGVENYTVTQATMDEPVAIIEIPSVVDPNFVNTYYVTINISTNLDKPSDPSIEISNVEVSSIPEPENAPPNMLDKDFNTRWSAEGEQWAVFDLGSVKDITGFGIAIYSSLARQQIMEILVSEDGENYTTLFKGRTSKLTTDMEYISFNPVKARYVKLNGSGNSSNAWNSITEIEIFGK